jgi:hypothetical protein
MGQSQDRIRLNGLYNDIIKTGSPSPIHGFVSA